MAKKKKETLGEKEFRTYAARDQIKQSKIDIAKLKAGNKIQYMGSSLTWDQYTNPDRHLLPGQTSVPKVTKQAIENAKSTRDEFLQFINGAKYSSNSVWGTAVSPRPFAGSPQYVIEEIMGIKNKENLISFDLETIGVAGTDFFSPTQIGLSSFALDADMAQRIIDGNLPSTEENLKNIIIRDKNYRDIALVISPDKKTKDKVQELINKVKQGKELELTRDERRSLIDLYSFGGDAKFGSNGVIISPNSKKLLDGTNLQQYIGRIETGFKNLQTHGLDLEQALPRVYQHMKSQNLLGSKMFGQNILSADVPWMEEAIGKIADPKARASAQKFMDSFGGNYVDLRATLDELMPDLFENFYSKNPYTDPVSSVGNLGNLYVQMFHEQMKDAHFALSDTYGAADVFGFQYVNILKSIKSGNLKLKPTGKGIADSYKNLGSSAQWSDDVIKKGSILFSRGSLSSRKEMINGTEFDLDIIQDGKSTYNSGYSIWKNRTYKVVKQYNDVYNGVPIYGVALKNEQDGTIHYINRTSQQSLQSSLQRVFTPIDLTTAGEELKQVRKYSEYDTARRAYESLFNGDEAYKNMSTYMDVMKKIRTSNPSDVSAFVNSMKDRRMTRSKKRDFQLFYGRLNKEYDLINDFMGADEFKKLPYNADKNLALRRLRENLDKEIGTGATKIALPTSVTRQISIMNPITREAAALNVNSRADMVGSIYRMLTNGKQEINMADVVERAKVLGTSLVRQGVMREGDWKSFLGRGRRGILSRLRGTPQDPTGGSLAIAQQLGTLIAKGGLVEQNLQQQLDVRDITGSAYGDVDNVKTLLGNRSSDVINASIRSASLNLRSGDSEFISNSAASLAAQINEQATKRAREVVGNSIPMPKSVSEELEELMKVMSSHGVVTTASAVKNSRGEFSGVQLMFASAQESRRIIQSGNIDPKKVVEAFIPVADSEGILTLGALSNINRLSIIRTSKGLTTGSATNSMFFAVRSKAQQVAELLANGKTNKANQVTKRAVQNVMEQLSSGSRYARKEIADDLVFSNRTSGWAKIGHIDASQAINNMLSNGNAGQPFMHKKGSKMVAIESLDDLSLREKQDLIRDIVYGGKTRSNGQYIDYKTDYGRQFAEETRASGYNLNLSSVKAEISNEFIFGLTDTRSLNVFGYHTTTAKENIRQGVNYYYLDDNAPLFNAENVANGTAPKTRAEMIGEKRLADIKNNIMATDVAVEQAAGRQTSYALRGANVTDDILKEVIIKNKGQEFWDNMSAFDRPSVTENMMVIKQSSADLFTTTRQKIITIDPSNGVQVDPEIMNAHRNGTPYYFKGYDGSGKPITVGQVMTENILDDKGEIISRSKFPGATAKGTEYTSQNPSLLKDIRTTEDGRIQVIMDELHPVVTGTKLASDFKGTLSIIPDKDWNDYFGKDFENVDFFGMTLDTKNDINTMARMQGDLNEAISVFTDRMTVGKMKKEQIQTEVENIVNDMIFGGKVRAQYKNGVLVFPSEELAKGGDISYRGFNEAVDKLYGDRQRGLTSPSGKTIPISRYNMVRVDVEDYPGAFGSNPPSGKGVHYGPRELFFIRGLKNTYGEEGFGGTVYNWLNQTVNQGSEKTLQQYQSFINSVYYGGTGQLKTSADGYAQYKIAGEFSADDNSILDPRKLKDLPLEKGREGYTPDQVAGSIIDERLGAAGKQGKGFFYNIPTVMIDGKSVNNVLMPYVPNQYLNGYLQPTDVQSDMLRIHRSTMDYLGAKDEAAKNKSLDNIASAVKSLYKDEGNAAVTSNGYLVEQLYKTRMPHSAMLKAHGFNISEYNNPDAIAAGRIDSKAGEGYTYITEKRALQMLDGIKDEKERDRILGMMNNDGYYAFYNRYPTIGQGSITPTKVKIASGMTIGDDTMTLTVGAIARSAADFDGDYGELVLTRVGQGVKGVSQKALEEDMEKLWQSERRINQALGEWAYGKLKKDMDSNIPIQDIDTMSELLKEEAKDKQGLNEFLKSKLSTDDLIIATEARLQKTVGPLSNLAKKYESLAEITDMYTPTTVGSRQISEIMNAFGTTMEQTPISAKHIATALGKENVDIFEYIEAADNLRGGLSSYRKDSIDDIISAAKTTGILEKEEGSDRWVLSGRANQEYFARNHANIYEEDLRESFGIMFDQTGSKGSPVYNAMMKFQGSEFRDHTEAMETITDLQNGKENIVTPEFMEHMRKMGATEEQLQSIEEKARASIVNSFQDVSAGGAYSYKPIEEAAQATAETIGSRKVAGFANTAEKILGSFKSPAGAIAIGALGAWAVSAALRGPNIEHEPAQGREDQAPSSDGSYVDIEKYGAGAPAGAGPSPRLSKLGSGYERVNVNIRGGIQGNMTEQDIAELISGEIQKQTGLGVNLNIRSQDDRESINSQWLQNQFMSALKTGYAN